MMKALFFDLGNVFVSFDWGRAVRSLSEVSTVWPYAIEDTLTRSKLASSFEQGRISPSVFFSGLQEEIQCQLPDDDIRRIWSDIFQPIERNISMLRELRKRHFLGLISNTNPTHIEWIRRQYGFLDLFDRLTFSYDVGVLKPEAPIYDAARGEFDPADIWFVDDMEANVQGARQLGWHASHLKPTMLLTEVLPDGVL